MQIKNFSTSITFALGTLVLLASNVAAHGHLTSPPIRIAPGDENQGLTQTRAPTTQEPCQGVPFQGVKTQFTPGQTFTYSWEIGAAHQGTCFMQLSTDNGATFQTIKEDPHCADAAGTFNDQATLPSGTTCAQCVLRWRWEAKLTGELYLNCADVSIGGGGGGNTGGSTDGSTGGSTGGSTSGSTGSGDGSTGSGDGSTGGSPSAGGSTGSGDNNGTTSGSDGNTTSGSDGNTTSSSDGNTTSSGDNNSTTSGSDGNTTSGSDGSTGGSDGSTSGSNGSTGGDGVPPEVPTVDPNGNTSSGDQQPPADPNTAGGDSGCSSNKTSGMRRRFSPRGKPLRLRRGD